MVSPGFARRALTPETAPGGSAYARSGRIPTAYCVEPEVRARTPGSMAFTCTVAAGVEREPFVTTTCAGPGVNVEGACAFTWPGLMYMTNAGWPLIVTVVPSSAVGAPLPRKSGPAHC